MDSNNICKFNPVRSSDLICTNFIFETNCCQRVPAKAEQHLVGLVTAGEGVLSISGQSHNLSVGTLFFVPRFELFSIEGADLAYYYISFHGRRGDELMTRFGICREICAFKGHDGLISFWRDSQLLAEDGNIDLLCEAALLYSLAALQPAKSTGSDVLSRIITLTQEHFTDPSLSISGIAAQLGYDGKYLSSLFKKKIGLTFTRYLRQMRIRHAIFLMEEGLVSVKNIALLSGFQDPLYFSKIFTESEGISPKAYITNLSNE